MINFNDRLNAALAGTAVTAALVISQPLVSMAFNGQKLSQITREITILVSSSNGQNGSGVIIDKQDDIYYVLTANHVTRNLEGRDGKIEYKAVTHDKETYEIDHSTIKPVGNNLDMAVFQFRSKKRYPVATISTSELAVTTPVFVSGWQRPGAVNPDKATRQVTSSRVTTILEEPSNGGYQIGYDNTTLGGMSGGPVVDSEGRLVGIHGLADNDRPENLGFQSGEIDPSLLNTGFNYGIPITTFLANQYKTGLSFSLDLENDPAKAFTGDSSIPTDPEKDEISDLNNVLTNANSWIDTGSEIKDTFKRGCGLLGIC